jgi:hypothetical protein
MNESTKARCWQRTQNRVIPIATIDALRCSRDLLKKKGNVFFSAAPFRSRQDWCATSMPGSADS